MSADRVLKTGVFVSHASADDELVSRIHDRLTAAGIDAWVDHEDRIGSSADWVNQIQAALNDYEAGLAVLSRDFIESFACRNECWTLLNLKKPLHVALIEPIPRDKFPWWLNTTEHLDFGADFDGSLTRLINAITGAPGSKTPAPGRTQPRRMPPVAVGGAPGVVPAPGRALITGTIDRRLTQIPISGRDTDLAHIKSLMACGPASILGVGGVGKSRLAAEIVLTAEGIDGVIWHVCSDLSRAEDVLIQLRDHLELELTASRYAILARLRAEKLLVVLDNGESVSDDRRPDYVTLINQLCHAGARVLITSRVEWEEIELGGRHTPHILEPDPARQVVLDMAAAWELENNLTPHAETIAKAARRHPRLIEWAVRQMKRFPPEKVIGDLQELKSERLQDALDEMIRKTLRQMTETAGPEPEAALRRLAVCRGGFSYEAARAILGLKNDTNTLDDCLMTLQTWQFVAKTVLPDGHTRYAVDPMALAAVPEDDSAFRPHYDYYRALARERSERQDYLGLDVESENLEAAFGWAMAVDDGEAAYWLANAISSFFWLTGGVLISARIGLAALVDHFDPELWAYVKVNLGLVFRNHPTGDRRTNLRRTVAAYEEALKYWTPETASLDYAMTQNNLGTAYSDLSNVEDREENLRRAVVAYEEALKYQTPQTDPLGYAKTRHGLGNVHNDLGDLAAAVACWREAERYYRLMGVEENADKMLRWIEEVEGGAGE